MKKVLIGCGIAAGLTIFLLVVGAILVGQFVQRNMPDTDRLEQLEAELEQRFGPPEDYVPPLDGDYDPQRVALYAELRSQLHPRSRPIAEEIGHLRQRAASAGEDSRWKKIKRGLSDMRAGLGLVSGSLGYLSFADSLLLDAGMGKGEYNHYNLIVVANALPDSVRALLRDGRASEAARVGEEFADEARNVVLDQLDNARRAIARIEEPTEEQRAWREHLGEELDRCGRDRHRWPFENDLPPGLAAALAAHRPQLAPTLPTNFAEFMAEMPLVMEVQSSGGGLQITVD